MTGATPSSLSTAFSVRLADERINEASGLACSVNHSDLIYTVNDEDGPVFAVDRRTGATVGTFRVAGRKLRDPEALSIGSDGVLWIADIGANRGAKKAYALYALAEPGPGDHGELSAARYRVIYPDGSRQNAEAFLVHPVTGDGYLITRGEFGLLYRVRAGSLDTSRKNLLEFVQAGLPEQITDACFTVDGAFVLVREFGRRKKVIVLDADTWRVVDEFRVPKVKQPESIAADPDGAHVWIGSEGDNSPLIRVALPAGYATRP
jgi:DNA-binding beta-propeller fold protein YncE